MYTMEQVSEQYDKLSDFMTEKQFEIFEAFLDGEIIKENEKQAQENEKQAQSRERQAQSREREEKLLKMQAIVEIIIGKQTLTNTEMSSAFHSIAVDKSLSLSPAERAVFLDLSSSFANGKSISTPVDNKTKKVFKKYAIELKNELKEYEKAILAPRLDILINAL